LVYLKTTSYIFDIIVLAETWLNDNLNICIDSYKYFHSLGTLNKADGVSIFIKDNIIINDVILNVVQGCNSLELTFNYNLKAYIVIIGLYSSLTINSFLVGLDHYLSNIYGNYRIVLCGDMNINILDNTGDVSDYLNILASYGFVSNSCIDHIFINDISNLSSYIVKTDITDHYSLAISINNDDFVEESNINNDTLKNVNKLKCHFSYLNNLLFSFN